MIAEGVAPKIVQSEEGATYDAMLKKDLVKLPLDQTAQGLHDYIRGCDHSPGAWVEVEGQVSASALSMCMVSCTDSCQCVN